MILVSEQNRKAAHMQQSIHSFERFTLRGSSPTFSKFFRSHLFSPWVLCKICHAGLITSKPHVLIRNSSEMIGFTSSGFSSITWWPASCIMYGMGTRTCGGSWVFGEGLGEVDMVSMSAVATELFKGLCKSQLRMMDKSWLEMSLSYKQKRRIQKKKKKKGSLEVRNTVGNHNVKSFELYPYSNTYLLPTNQQHGYPNLFILLFSGEPHSEHCPSPHACPAHQIPP